MTQRNVQRDERLLTHLGLYRISLRPLIAVSCCQGRDPGNVLVRLMAEGRVRSRSGLPDRLCYYQLTEEEAARRGLPTGRSRAPKPQAFLMHLAVVWHCVTTVPDGCRRRLDVAQMTQTFGASAPKGTHVLDVRSSPRILRVMVAGPTTSVRSIIKTLRRRLDEVHRHPTLGVWVRSRQYGFLVLLEGEARRTRLLRMVTRHELVSRTEFEVAHAPDHRTIAQCLRLREQRSSGATGHHGRAGG